MSKCELCGEIAANEYEGHQVCAGCYGRINSHEEKARARLERLQAQAQRAADDSRAAFAKAHQMAEVIPFGQPILVGHHSESRDRAFRERIWNTQRRAYAAYEKAQRLERRAAAAENNHAISSDDPAALLKLRNKLAKLEAAQSTMTDVNKFIRKLIGGKVERIGVVGHHGTVDEINARFRAEKERVAAVHQTYLQHAPALAEQTGNTEAWARAMLTPDVLGRIGYPDYALKNNSAEIRRVKKRIIAMEATTNSGGQPEQESHGDITLARDTDDNRLRLMFPGKPSAEIRAKLKAHGFRWSPSNNAWQRQLNPAAEYAASLVLSYISSKEQGHV